MPHRSSNSVGTALDALAGPDRPGQRGRHALSPIGMAVRAGSPVPDISTTAKLRQVLLDAKSVAYSDSASGVYIQNTLFKKLGIEQQMEGKVHKIQATPVGEVVAHGKADIGFQEVAELLPVKGITFAGRLPQEVELFTRYSAAVAKRSNSPTWQTTGPLHRIARHRYDVGKDGAPAAAAVNRPYPEWAGG